MNENEQENKKTATSNLDIKLWAVGSVLFILMSVFGYLAYLNLHFPPTERENYATLGDSFGILSSLFSGLAFAGLIVTIVMQNKTLKAQMEELELARKEYKRQGDELAGQKEVMNAQFESIQRQQIETTLFKVIDTHRGILENHKINKGDTECSGYEFIDILYKSPYQGIDFDQLGENNAFFDSFYRGVLAPLKIIDSIELSNSLDVKRFYVSIFKEYFRKSDLAILIRIISSTSDDNVSLIKKSNFIEAKDLYLFGDNLFFNFHRVEDLSFKLDCTSMIVNFISVYGSDSLDSYIYDEFISKYLHILYKERGEEVDFLSEFEKEMNGSIIKMETLDLQVEKLFLKGGSYNLDSWNANKQYEDSLFKPLKIEYKNDDHNYFNGDDLSTILCEQHYKSAMKIKKRNEGAIENSNKKIELLDKIILESNRIPLTPPAS